MKVRIGDQIYILQRSKKGKWYLRRFYDPKTKNQRIIRGLFTICARKAKGKKFDEVKGIPPAASIVEDCLKGVRVGRMRKPRLSSYEKHLICKKLIKILLLKTLAIKRKAR